MFEINENFTEKEEINSNNKCHGWDKDREETIGETATFYFILVLFEVCTWFCSGYIQDSA